MMARRSNQNHNIFVVNELTPQARSQVLFYILALFIHLVFVLCSIRDKMICDIPTRYMYGSEKINAITA